uniref:Filamin binding LIM protein 1 n=1 Tax=Malurus cyaneus samueli TaxID=2593467 RepID=A0A8C5U6Q6_9PASS
MLPGKAEKRIASSIFITLVPPQRGVATKEKTQRELQPDNAEVPSTHCPQILLPPPTLPNRGEGCPWGAVSSMCTGSSPLRETEACSSKLLSLPLADICAFCHKALGPQELTVEAMRKQYHPDCFTCRTCHRLLAGQRYFQKDGCPMCDTCFQATLEKCAKCRGLITEHIVRALGKGYHPSCFCCAACGRSIGTESFAVDEQGDTYCVPDFYRKYAAVCGACERPIVPCEDEDTYKIECLGRSFHESCYRCESCGMPLSPELTENGCYPLDDHLLCKSCHVRWRNESSC